MSQLPLKARLRDYRGSDPKKRMKVAEHNAMAYRVVNHIHKMILNNPDELQEYSWFSVARQLDLSASEVESAVMYGGHNAITIGVSESDRESLKQQLSP